LTEREWDGILRVLRGFFTSAGRKPLHRGLRALHRRFVIGAHSAGLDFGWSVEAVSSREILHDLNAAAMAVHVAEAADVHENVEAELLSGGEGTQQFIVLAAMAQAEVDDFVALRRASRFDGPAKLTVGI